MRSRILAIAASVAVAELLSACSSGASRPIAVVDSWAPATPPGAPAAAIYLTIENGTAQDDTLVAVASSSCEAVELHATHFDDDGIMRMRLADPELLVISSGDRLEMTPGGLHVMCIGLAEPFERGDGIELTVFFEAAGGVSATATVENR
jgi:hypothetical protein